MLCLALVTMLGRPAGGMPVIEGLQQELNCVSIRAERGMLQCLEMFHSIQTIFT